MAAHELIDEAYLRVANRGNQPDKDAQLAGLVLLVEALRSLPGDPDERQAELARVRHPKGIGLFGDFSPERVPRAAVTSVGGCNGLVGRNEVPATAGPRLIRERDAECRAAAPTRGMKLPLEG